MDLFLGDMMHNGFDAKIVNGCGVHKLGIEHTRARMVRRGVLLEVARHKGVEWLEDGHRISNVELDTVAADEGVEIRKGDFVIRTRQLERCLNQGAWGG